jgi:hypothetical protein
MRLEIEPERYRQAESDEIDLPLFQLTEEGVHRVPRCLRSVGYSGHHVEPAIRLPSIHTESDSLLDSFRFCI